MAITTIFFRFLSAVFRGQSVSEIAVIVARKIVIAKIVTTKIVATKIPVTKILAGRFDAARIGCSGGAGFACRGAEVGENGLLLDLALAQGGEVVADGFFFVKADLAGVGAYESFVEDATGKLIEVFFFEGAQHARAEFGGVGDGVEGEAAQLALLAKFFSERSHEWLRRAGFRSVRNRNGNNHRRRLRHTPHASGGRRLPLVVKKDQELLPRRSLGGTG